MENQIPLFSAVYENYSYLSYHLNADEVPL